MSTQRPAVGVAADSAVAVAIVDSAVVDAAVAEAFAGHVEPVGPAATAGFAGPVVVPGHFLPSLMVEPELHLFQRLEQALAVLELPMPIPACFPS